MDNTMEQAQLLARFKLAVKRGLGESIDLYRLTRDADYARERLSELEEKADDEALLVMLLRVRESLLPSPPAPVETGAAPANPAVPSTQETRSYLLGARAW